MVSRPTVQVNLGRASSLVAAAAATMETICREIDERIAAEIVPTDADYLRQVGLATSALDQLRDAMTELLSTQGGNGLRESGHFERRWRDFQAMPLHINAHRDRAHHQIGRLYSVKNSNRSNRPIPTRCERNLARLITHHCHVHRVVAVRTG